MEFDFNQGVYSGLSTPQASLSFPSMYGYEEARGFIWNSGESVFTLGCNGDSEDVVLDLNRDPHILLSAASNAGKSTVARSLATQALLKGFTVVFLDAKRHSHRWAKQLPMVHYASSMDEIGNALVSVAMETHRRNRVVDEFPGPIEEAPVGPPILVVYEEMNATGAALKALDKKLPPRGVYTASQGFGDIMFMGRAAKVHVLAISQFADAKTISTDLRENFSFRILIKHTSNAWNMLAFGAGYAPPAPQQIGRGFVVQGDKARETQFLYLDEEDCAELVRQTYDARKRAGLVEEPSRREMKLRARDAQRALTQATGLR